MDVNSDFDPETVFLLKDEKRFKIPLKNLSQADREYVIKVRAGRSLGNDADNKPAIVADESDNISPRQRYALLIGVNRYARPIKSLQYCVKDMELLASCLQKTGVPKENIILITDSSPLERRPTGGNIRRQIEALTTLMAPDDQLIVAFSGHGVMVDGESYLCPGDTDLKDKKSLVSRDWVFDKLEQCRAKHKVFIVDACRNEISFNGGKSIGLIKTLEDPIGADTHGFILIASCDKKQFSWEHPDIQHGVFTYFFAQGLSGRAKNDEGYVTILGLFQYANSRTQEFVHRKYQVNQVPTFRQGGEMTDFALARIDNSVTTDSDSEAPPPPPLNQFPTGKLKAGSRHVIKMNNVEFAFRYCPPGSFIMGSPESEQYREKDEQQHLVTLSKGFWIMETEVTQKQWVAIMGDNPCENEEDELPVYDISWNDCQRFVKRCAAYGLTIQLPTEAQWEYACRAGTTGMHGAATYSLEDYVCRAAFLSNVAEEIPNAWGVYNMNGNAYEWCQDWYGEYPRGKVTDPTGPSTGRARVYRGGGIFERSAGRSSDRPESLGNSLKKLGFRCVKVQ